MTIGEILHEKGHRVETIWPEHTLADVIARFSEHNIASVVVTDHAGVPIGIVTDRLAVRALARGGNAAMAALVTEVMDPRVPICSERDGVADIMRRMTYDRIRHVVVVDGKRIVGIVGIGDLVKAKLRDADLESRVLRERALSRMAAE